MDPNAIAGLVADVGAIGFILFLTHRLTTVTVPELVSKFTETNEKQRQDFRRFLDQQRDDFKEWQQREITSHDKQVSSIIDALKELATEVRSGKNHEL